LRDIHHLAVMSWRAPQGQSLTMTGDPPADASSRHMEAASRRSTHAPDARAPDTPTRVTVILPLYNEAASIELTVNDVARFALDHPGYAFLFVDDGSSDGTPDVLAATIAALTVASPSLADRLGLIRSRVNTGKGYAVHLGIRAARGGDDDLVLFTDGDLAYSLDHLPRLVEALGAADVAIGSRRGPEGGYRATPVRTLMGWSYNRLARACLASPYRDTQAGLKGFRIRAAREIFGALRGMGFGFDVELLYLAQRFGFRVAQIPATVSPSHHKRGSSVSLWRDPYRMLVGIAGIRLSSVLGQYDRRQTGRWPLALLSFDAEEFDLPGEYGHPIPRDQQFAVARDATRRMLDLLGHAPARATIFTTADFAESSPDLIRECVAHGHEIASHGASHSRLRPRDLLDSRRRLEAITGVPVRGFRSPRMAPVDPRQLRDAGYTYDSSLHPTWIPGRYNNLRSPRRPFQTDGLVRIPPSTTPLLRFPLFWLAFKNIPGSVYRTATRRVLDADGCAALYFHPWELADLRSFGLPAYVRRIDGQAFAVRLTRYLRWLSRRAEFVTYAEAEQRFRARAWPYGSPLPAADNPRQDMERSPARAEIRVLIPSIDRGGVAR
jgi:glycosyltransferase involved in cell wall biosynthesis